MISLLPLATDKAGENPSQTQAIFQDLIVEHKCSAPPTHPQTFQSETHETSHDAAVPASQTSSHGWLSAIDSGKQGFPQCRGLTHQPRTSSHHEH